MGTTACCKFNKDRESELMAGRGGDVLFNQGAVDDPLELDQRFERLLEVFPFALERVVVCLKLI